MSVTRQRRLAAGVEMQPDSAPHARVWAPARKSAEIVLDSNRARTLAARAGGSGVFRRRAARHSNRRSLLGAARRTDAAARSRVALPAGRSDGPSMVVDPQGFEWTDASWRGIEPDGQALYELHVGTFTPEGTWRAAAAQLDALVDLGDHGRRNDAGRRFSRPVRLGLRRRQSLCADPALRHARRSPGVRRSRARGRPRRDPRRRLQPPRARRQLPGGVLAGLLHGPLQERLGAGA